MFTPWITDDPQEIFAVQGNLTPGQANEVRLYVGPSDTGPWSLYCSDTTIGPGDGFWTCDTVVGTLLPGDNYLTATGRNDIGEESIPAPGAEILITLVASPEITSPPSGFVTNDPLIAFSGTSDPLLAGGIANLRDSVTTDIICTSPIDVAGDWSCTPAIPLPNGQNEQFVEVSPGFSLLSIDTVLWIDTTPPVEADILSPTGPFDGFVYHATTTDTTPVISGVAEPGATINLYQDFAIASCGGGPPIVSGVGTWSCTITTPLTVGQFYEFGTTTVDAAGNISTMGTPDTQILLEILPAPPPPPPPAPPPPAAAPALVWMLDFIAPTGDVRPGETVTVSGTLSGTGVLSGVVIVVELHSDPVVFGRTIAAPDGGFTITATVPDSVEPGDHEWVVTAAPSGEAPVTKRSAVTVLALPEPEPEPGAEDEKTADGPTAAPDAGGSPGASADRADPAGMNVLSGALPTIADVFANPIALGIAGASALILMAFVVFPAELLNNTLASRYGALFGRLFGGAGKGRRPWMERLREWFSRSRLPSALGIIGVASLIFCFADPDFGLDLASLRLFVACFLALVVVCVVAAVIARRYLDVRWRLRSILEVQPLGLILGIIGIIVTRLLDFSPGIMIGLVVGLALAGSVEGRDHARAVATFSTAVLGISVLAWVGYSVLLGMLGGAPSGFVDALALDTLAAIPAEGLGALLVGLLPLRGLDGAEVWSHSKLGWAALYGISLTAFWLIIVADDGNWGELGSSVAGWGTVLIVFALVAVGVYLYFRWSDRRAELREAQQSAAAESRGLYPPIG